MSISKYLLIILSYLSTTYTFLIPKSHDIVISKNRFSNSNIILRAHGNHSFDKNVTRSRVYKMDYRSDEEKELEEFFRPKYLFNLSDYHMTFIRIYIYITIILNIITYIMLKK